jgi:hypothetical protein
MKKIASKKSIPKAQIGSIVKTVAKAAKVIDKGSDAAKLAAKRAAAVKKAQQAEDLRVAFQRSERKDLKEMLKAADKKGTTPKKQMGGPAGPGGTPTAGGAKLTPTTGSSKKGFKKFIKKAGSKF